jgi:membrane protease YdiL (CAAX protease family)
MPVWIWPVAGAFMVLPLHALASAWWTYDWPVRFWMMGAVLGAVPLGWAMVNARAFTLRCLALCFVTAGLWGLLAFSAASALKHHGIHFHDHAWKGFGTSFALYLPVCFVMEEVFFRGALDSFVQRPGDRHYWLSAAFVSVLWGWWHLPISGMSGIGLAVLAAFYPLFHLPFGLCFSHYWRRGGNLLVPAAVHAFVDAFRNVVI